MTALQTLARRAAAAPQLLGRRAFSNAVRALGSSSPSSAAAIPGTAEAPLPFTAMPTPPYDDPPIVPGTDTTVNYFMRHGGPHGRHYFNQKLYDDYGDIVRTAMPGSPPWINIFRQEEMLKVHSACGPTPAGSTLGLWFFMEYYNSEEVKARWNGKIPMAFVADPQEWKRLRHALQRGIFGQRDVEAYLAPFLAPVVEDAMDELPRHQGNIYPWLNKLTFEMVASVILGVRPNVIKEGAADERDLKFVEDTVSAINFAADLMFSPTARMIADPDENVRGQTPRGDREAWAKFESSMGGLLEIAAVHVNEAIDMVQRGEQDKLSSMGVDPWVVRLVRAGELDRDEIVQNVAGLLRGGVDTTANTLLLILVSLAKHTDVQDKAREEIRAAGVRRLEDPAVFKQLPYTKAIVDETMRLTPTAGGHLRLLNKDVVLYSSQTAKHYAIPAGSICQYSHAPGNCDPKLVENADEFDPGRFTREAKAARRGSDAARIDHPVNSVFSFGPRMCLGARLAKMELNAFLFQTLLTYRVELDPPDQEWTLYNSMLTRPVTADGDSPKLKFTKL